MKNIMTISNVKGYINENGIAMLNASDVARGLGFTQTKKSIEYIRWETVNSYLSEFGFSQLVGKDDYLPENAVYRLIFKAKNQVAVAFQTLLSDEILPSLRKNGIYMTGQNEMNDEEFLANAVLRASAIIEKKNERIKQLENSVNELQNTLEAQEPLVILAQKLEEDPDTWHSFKDAPALLNNGYGQNQLFALARRNHDLIDGGKQHNHPYQHVVNRGYYKLKVNGGHYNHDNEYVPSYKTLISNRGLCHLIRLIRKEQKLQQAN